NLWRDSAKEVFEADVFTGETAVDLCILGGGFTGCSAALTAAQAGASVLLLEAETVGHGGSGRNVGLVNAGLWLPPQSVCDALGQAQGTRLNAALAAAPGRVYDLIETHDIACEPVRNGTLHCAHSARGFKDLQARFEQQQALGAPVTLLDAAAARARTGSEQVHGALHDARAGTIQPLAYARGLARAAVQHGARICEHSPVKAVSREGSDWFIKTPQGTVKAGKILIATNAYHQPVKGAEVPATTPVHYFQLATEPLGHNEGGQVLPGGEGCWDTGTVMTSFRKDQAGRVILGAMGNPDALGLHEGWARRALKRLFPQVGDAPFQHFWSGRIAMTSDHIPKVMRVGDAGYAVFGYSGRGIGPGTVIGAAVAQALLTGDEAHLPLDAVDGYAEAFTGAKGQFYELAARLVHAGGARLV
ncbi:MAG: FAD-binding oxidoreductase, partial [Rhodobacterales bacterium]|nr:FAD-binding oxidoreductase [Rhodobacterales bacterium]